jgi:hypothetical protein
VVDRYQALYLLSRSDPNRPFADPKLIEEFSQVASEDVIARLIQSWQRFRADGSAVRAGPSEPTSLVITGLFDVSPHSVSGTTCIFDNAITFAAATGEVRDRRVGVDRGQVGFSLVSGRWQVSRDELQDSQIVAPGAANPCHGPASP